MLTKNDIETLADTRLGDATHLFNAARYSAAFYLAGYAVELGIKACIANLFRAQVIPDKSFVNAVYIHKLDALLGLAGIKQHLQDDMKNDSFLSAAWGIASQWDETSRYQLWGPICRCEYDPSGGRLEPWSTAVAEETLVESVVSDSVKLVEQLDTQGDPPSNALWYFFSDAEKWRLLIAGETFDSLLPKDEARAYQKVAAAIQQGRMDSLTIADVKLVRTDDPVLVATKFVIKTPAHGVVRAHFRDNTFNGIFVKEMLVLRAA